KYASVKDLIDEALRLGELVAGDVHGFRLQNFVRSFSTNLVTVSEVILPVTFFDSVSPLKVIYLHLNLPCSARLVFNVFESTWLGDSLFHVSVEAFLAFFPGSKIAWRVEESFLIADLYAVDPYIKEETALNAAIVFGGPYTPKVH